MPCAHDPQNLGFTPSTRNNTGPERSTISLGLAQRHGANRVSGGGSDGRDPTIHGADDDV